MSLWTECRTVTRQVIKRSLDIRSMHMAVNYPIPSLTVSTAVIVVTVTVRVLPTALI